MRKMSLDLGDRRIGVATSDLLGLIANPLETYTRSSLKADIEHIAKLVKDHEVDCIVLGLPINMDGTEGERVEKSREFGRILSENIPNVKIDYMDERWTTVSAEKMLIEADVSREKRKTVIDKVAATIILQSYLDKTKK